MWVQIPPRVFFCVFEPRVRCVFCKKKSFPFPLLSQHQSLIDSLKHWCATRKGQGLPLLPEGVSTHAVANPQRMARQELGRRLSVRIALDPRRKRKMVF